MHNLVVASYMYVCVMYVYMFRMPGSLMFEALDNWRGKMSNTVSSQASSLQAYNVFFFFYISRHILHYLHDHCGLPYDQKDLE